MIRRNYLKEKLENGKQVLGTWLIIPSPITTDIIASVGLDFVIIDAEHGPISYETAQEMVMACEDREVSPIMRIGSIDESDILRALDIGVHGIQIPKVETKKDVDDIILFSKYPPVGERGYSPFTRAGDYSSIQTSKSFTHKANSNTLIGINIEGMDAIEKIDEILTNEHLDIVFVGLFDLSKALGKPGEVEHPEVIDYLEMLVEKINKSGKHSGTIATTKGNMLQYLDMGVKYLVYLVDCDMLKRIYIDVKCKFDNYHI